MVLLEITAFLLLVIGAVVVVAVLLGGALSLGPGLAGIQAYERQCKVGMIAAVTCFLLAGGLLFGRTLV